MLQLICVKRFSSEIQAAKSHHLYRIYIRIFRSKRYAKEEIPVTGRDYFHGTQNPVSQATCNFFFQDCRLVYRRLCTLYSIYRRGRASLGNKPTLPPRLPAYLS